MTLKCGFFTGSEWELGGNYGIFWDPESNHISKLLTLLMKKSIFLKKLAFFLIIIFDIAASDDENFILLMSKSHRYKIYILNYMY